MDPEEQERLRQERLLNQQLMGNVGSSNISQTFAPTEPTTITTGFEGLLGQPKQLAQPSTPQVQADTTLLGMDASRANELAEVLGTTAGVVGTGVAAKNLLDAFSGKSLASEMSNLDVVKRQKLINEFRAENIDPKTGRIKKGASPVGFDAPSTTKGQAARSIFGKGVSGALRFLTKGGVLGEAIAPTSLGDATISGAYDRRIAAGEDPAVVEADLYGPEGRPLSGPDAIMQNRSTAPTTFETPVIQSTPESAAPVTPTLPTIDTPDVFTGFEGTVPVASAAQAMKEQLGIPAPSDMSPNVPVGTGTVMQGSGPIAGQSVMQGIRDMDTQAAQAAQMTQQILDPQGRLRRGSVDPQTGQVTLAPEYSGYEEAAAARQARAMQESTFMESVPDSQRRGDGLSDSEMRRYMKGKDPKASDREKAYSARIDMQRKNEATQTAAQQAMDLAQMRIDASVESQEAAQENAMKLARIRKQLTPSEAREAELKIEALEQSVAAGNQVDPSDIQKVLTSVGIPTLGDIKYDAQRNVFVDTAGLNETFGPESAVFRILAGTKVGRTIMGGGPNMKVISTRPSQG